MSSIFDGPVGLLTYHREPERCSICNPHFTPRPLPSSSPSGGHGFVTALETQNYVMNQIANRFRR